MTGRLLAGVALATLLVACGGGAEELLDTAELEETQNNLPHARELYQQIVEKYPGTDAAQKAAERLKATGAK